MDRNNENSFTSGIRPPSKIPSQLHSPGKLHDVVASSLNARPKAMPPPPNDPKRETLVQRAGQTSRPAVAPPSSRQVNAYVRATSIAGAPRDPSFSSSVSSSRPSSVASTRNASNSSYSSSVGSGNRPPSAQSYRPQSAMGLPKYQRSTYSQGRPATSLETYQEEPNGAQILGKRKGRIPISSTPNHFAECLHSPKQRGSRDTLTSYATDWERRPFKAKTPREISLITRLASLSLEDRDLQSFPKVDANPPVTPSHIPKMVPPVASPCKSPKKPPPPLTMFINRNTNERVAWDPSDTDSRLEEMEKFQKTFKETMRGATDESNALREAIVVYKTRIAELETIRTQWASNNSTLQAELDAAETRLVASQDTLEDAKRHQNIRLDDMQRQYRRDLEDAQHTAETQNRCLVREYTEKMADLQRSLDTALEDERSRHEKEVHALSGEGASRQQELEHDLERQREAFQSLDRELGKFKVEIDREQATSQSLRDQLAASASNTAILETSVRRLEGHVHFLESDNKTQSQSFADLESRMQDALKSAAEANDKLRTEETLRRKLHNQVQELKGNIRVFCRVRPSLDAEPVDSTAQISYPDDASDSKEVEVLGQEEKSSLGNITTKKHAFAFDRVFGPGSQNQDVFGEISQLVQSALDGYNVCIFCYGQTGSGKTFTMSANDGMIPRAVHQIYDTAKSLEEKGWRYTMEGSFIEVYNENLNDLLGKAEEFDKKKHEIRHDMQKCKTTITGITSVDLDSPGKVESILTRATANRSVAATQANERSSRSHSVFILKLNGENSITGEKSEGTLNLVDLAGSERLSHSGATGERLKETQNINKSLSCLGDVIGALGQGKEGGHVPYRNSKLTYLLQFSLGGNSKTLMFVMISPLQAHLSETLTSLKFATKVHNTHIGTAKKQTKTRDS